MTTDQPARFVPGHQLSAALYRDCVRPTLARRFPRLVYAAALIGHGSDVLGYDTARSIDHDWGPRLHIVVDEVNRTELGPAILQAIEDDLPETLLDVPVDLPGAAQLPGEEIAHHNSPGTGRHHGVIITSIEQLMSGLLGTTQSPEQWDAARWICTPQQSLLEFTAGPLHHDTVGDLSSIRTNLEWYPHDVWLYLMSGRWQRIGQFEAFVGRCGELGDDLGSRVVAAQIVRDVMRLALLQHRSYAPYPKWLGTAFSRSECDGSLTDPLAAALAAATWQDRQGALIDALLELSRRHDALDLSTSLHARAERYFDRPYLVIWAERHARAVHAAITDDAVARLPFGLGGIDEITDSTDGLGNERLRSQIADAYRL